LVKNAAYFSKYVVVNKILQTTTGYNALRCSRIWTLSVPEWGVPEWGSNAGALEPGLCNISLTITIFFKINLEFGTKVTVTLVVRSLQYYYHPEIYPETLSVGE
jgi:hypothetical protein